uniref:SJCHGC07189 protein n=1 Tax=Schistosoma japonicum TaxID=6182 RepID=Q5D9J7_SCHJA|nr:SJCHGC07189 protein [Schistosoma japonicum]
MLLAYDFKIRYKSTMTFGHADVLSRLIATQKFDNEDVVIATVSLEDDIHHILQTSIQATPLSAIDVKSTTRTDEELQTIIRYLLCGWPPHLNATERQYFHRRDALAVVDDCLMFGDRVVIPKSLRHKVLSQLHSAHPGVVRMKALARSYVYWPNIDTDVMNYVLRCSKCAQAAKPLEKPNFVAGTQRHIHGSRVHVDFAGPLMGNTT